jgi:hypothetical protein
MAGAKCKVQSAGKTLCALYFALCTLRFAPGPGSARPLHYSVTPFPIAKDAACGKPARTSKNARSGVRARSSKVQTRDRHRVLAAARDRPHEHDLVEGQLAVRYRSFGESISLGEVARREDGLMPNA